MKKTYFIEFRTSGKLKEYPKQLVKELKRKFGHLGVTRKRLVPHLTIIKPFQTIYNHILLREILRVIEKYKPMKVKTRGFGHFNDHTIYIDFKTPKELLNLRNDIAKRLNKAIPDLREKFIIRKTPDFHLTLAFREISNKFDEIMDYIKKKKNPKIEQRLNRLTILIGNRIYREIDLETKRVYTRKEVKEKAGFFWRRK